MKYLIIVCTFIILSFPAKANCSNPCLYNYINNKTGDLILSQNSVKKYSRYVWRGWDRYKLDVKKIMNNCKSQWRPPTYIWTGKGECK